MAIWGLCTANWGSMRKQLRLRRKLCRSELNKTVQVNQERIQGYPRESEAYGNLGFVYGELGQYEKAAEIATQALRRAPDQVILYDNLANYALALQRFDEPRQIIHETRARRL